MADDLVVQGLDATLKMLDELPREIVMRAWLKALLAGAKVIEEYLNTYTPEYDGNRDENIPRLADSIVINLTLDSGARGGIATIGWGGNMAHIARWVEYGHLLIGHKPDMKYLKTIPPNPFIKQAANAAYEATVQAFQDALVQTLVAEVPSFEETFASAGGAVTWFPS